MSKKHLVAALRNSTRRSPSLRASRKPLAIGFSTSDKLKRVVHDHVVRGCIGGNSCDETAWESFVAAGSLGLARVEVHQARDRMKLWWVDGHESEFSLKWIRDNSPDSFSSETYQREVDTFAIPDKDIVLGADTNGAQGSGSLKLKLVTNSAGEQMDTEVDVPADWLRRHCTSSTARALRREYFKDPGRMLWGADVFSRPDSPCFHFDDIVSSPLPSGRNALDDEPSKSVVRSPAWKLLLAVRSFGIALVRGVPTTMEGTRELALRVGAHPRRTVYGPDMWATSAGADSTEEGFQDSAYSNGELASHTDCTYFRDPPGLQVFNCGMKARVGGASTYVDGLAVAERLRTEDPEAFEFLSRTPISYRWLDNGHYFHATGPIFQLGEQGRVSLVRFNDYDRAPLDHLSNYEIEQFYKHHRSLTSVIRDPSMVARIILEPGETVIMDNQRALHGRDQFQGRRRLVGCYIGMDEFLSTARMYGL